MLFLCSCTLQDVQAVHLVQMIDHCVSVLYNHNVHACERTVPFGVFCSIGTDRRSQRVGVLKVNKRACTLGSKRNKRTQVSSALMC